MFIRGLLILSLIAQLACSYQCCGITILCECLFWPRPCSGSACVAGDGCDPIQGDCCVTATECTSQAETCCVAATDCFEIQVIESPCNADVGCNGDAVVQSEDACSGGRGAPASPRCTPIDPKARRPQDIEKSPVDRAAIAPTVAHPLLPAALVVGLPRSQDWWTFQPQFKSNHQRQAALELWLN